MPDGIFASRACFDRYVEPIGSYTWSGDGVDIPEVLPPGPDFPGIPPFDILAGCACPTVNFSSAEPGNTPSTSLGFSISPKGGDCCELDFCLNFEPPCIPNVTVEASLSGIFSSRGGSFALSTSGSDVCDLAIIGNIDFPCPTILATPIELITQVYPHGPVHVSRRGAFSLLVSSLADCEFGIGASIAWPCPTTMTMRAINEWTWAAGSSTYSNQADPVLANRSKGAFYGYISESSCEFNLLMNIAWPCPTTMSVCTSNYYLYNPTASSVVCNYSALPALDSHIGLLVGSISESSCEFTLNFNIGWPCPVSYASSVSMSVLSSSSKSGTFSASLSQVESACDFLLDCKIGWPCTAGFTTTASNCSWTSNWGTSAGSAVISMSHTDSCNFDILTSLFVPCTSLNLSFVTSVNSAIEVPSIEVGSYSTDTNCRAGQDFILWFPEYTQAAFGIIQEVAGTAAPYIYRLSQVSHLSSNSYTSISGGRSYYPAFNLFEAGVNPYPGKLAVGTIVCVMSGNNNEWLIDANNYQGTYG